MVFADRLETDLKARGIECLIDRSEIYAFEDWWQRIQELISKADTVVFVLSPDSVSSEIALKEVGFAASLNKRFAPVVCRRPDDKAIPEALARLNFVFFDNTAQFDQSVDRLAEALDTDIAWIRQHTEFGEAAWRWVLAKRPNGLLLRSPVLEQAERWIAGRPRGAPAPTVATQTFVAESRRVATRRRNVLTGGLVAGLLLALGLAGLAYWQRAIAVEQRGIAERNEERAKRERDKSLLGQSRLLASVANQNIRDGDAGTAMALTLEALLPDARGVERPYTPEAEASMFGARGALRERLLLVGHDKWITDVAVSPDGERIATASFDDTARLWAADSGKEILVLRGHESALYGTAFSPDGRHLVTTSADKTARVWNLQSGREVLVLRHNSAVRNAAFSPDGRRIVTALTGAAAVLWEVDTGRRIAVLQEHEEDVTSAVFSPDGLRILTASHDGTARIWEAETGKQELVLKVGGAALWRAAFSPDGRRVVAASGDSAHFNSLTLRAARTWVSSEDIMIGSTARPSVQTVVMCSLDQPTARRGFGRWKAVRKSRCFGDMTTML